MNLIEAVNIHENCDPDACDCENCPIGNAIEWEVNDSGVFLKGTICSMLFLVKDMIEQDNKG